MTASSSKRTFALEMLVALVLAAARSRKRVSMRSDATAPARSGPNSSYAISMVTSRLPVWNLRARVRSGIGVRGRGISALPTCHPARAALATPYAERSAPRPPAARPSAKERRRSA